MVLDMYKCKECEEFYKEPERIKTTFESLYGIVSLFQNQNELEFDVCPYCEEAHCEENKVEGVEYD